MNTSKALYFRKNAGVLKQLVFEEKDGKKKVLSFIFLIFFVISFLLCEVEKKFLWSISISIRARNFFLN